VPLRPRIAKVGLAFARPESFPIAKNLVYRARNSGDMRLAASPMISRFRITACRLLVVPQILQREHVSLNSP